jgi:chemotaxis protein histidine kinase CheA
MNNLKKYELIFCRQTKQLTVDLQKNLEILARNPIDKDVLEESLRQFHTLKGSAATMKCRGLENFAKTAEETIKSAKSIDQLKSSCQEIESLAGDFKKLKKYPL